MHPLRSAIACIECMHPLGLFACVWTRCRGIGLVVPVVWSFQGHTWICRVSRRHARMPRPSAPCVPEVACCTQHGRMHADKLNCSHPSTLARCAAAAPCGRAERAAATVRIPTPTAATRATASHAAAAAPQTPPHSGPCAFGPAACAARRAPQHKGRASAACEGKPARVPWCGLLLDVETVRLQVRIRHTCNTCALGTHACCISCLNVVPAGPHRQVQGASRT